MKTSATALLLATLASTALAGPSLQKRATFDGFKAFRVKTHQDPDAVAALIGDLPVEYLNIDQRENMDLIVSPEDAEAFERLPLEREVLSEDFGADVAAEGPLAPYEGVSARAALPDVSWFDNYHSYADHVTWFKDLQAAFPSNSEMVSAGKSYEGRDLYGMHLWGKGGKNSKPAIYFHGTVHAREWVTTMVVEYLTYKLIEDYGTDSTTTNILDNYDFYIFPVVNPDGFSYSQTSYRLWRKNRMPRSGSRCVGTDINRNWPHSQWAAPGGASTNTCSDVYKGITAGDTPEMQALVSYTQQIAQNNGGIKLYIDWHSYGQYILIPYGYDCSKRLPDHTFQMSLAGNTASTIRSYSGASFTYGPSCSTLYATTGSSTDYMTDNVGAEYAWTFELRPSSGTSNGFVLPASQIMPAATEQWEAMKYLIPSL